MLILAIHQTPSLTQEKYEEVVRRLTGKSGMEPLWSPVVATSGNRSQIG